MDDLEGEEDYWSGVKVTELERMVSSETEQERRIEDYSTGESIAKALYGNRTGPRINIIPGIPSSKCYGRLDLVIGKTDNFELMLLRALKHAAFGCRRDGRTANRFIVIKTTQWNPKAWLDCEQEFASLKCWVFKKEIGSRNVQRLL